MRSWSAAPLAFALFAGCAYPGSAVAQMSDDVVKLGVLTDMTSLYSDATGSGSLIAAQMAAEDYGGKVKGKPIEVIGADHQNKPDIGSNIARQWYDTGKVDAIVDVPTSSIALAVQQITRDKDKVLLMSGPGASDLTGPACSPNGIHWTYDTFALSKVGAKAMVARGEDSWFFITADYAFGHALERDAAAVVKRNNGKVLGAVRAPLNTNDFSSFLLQAQACHRSRQCRRRHAKRHQAGGGIRAAEERPEAGFIAVSDHRCPQPGTWDRPRHDPDRGFLLGHGRCEPRLLAALSKAGRPHADNDPGRHLFGGDALSRGHRCGRNGRGQAGDCQDEGNPDPRFLCEERPHSR